MPKTRSIPALLPAREGDTWQGGWFPTPIWVQEGGRPVHPWVPMWVSTGERFVEGGDAVLERGSDDLVLNALDSMLAKLAGRPQRIEVLEPGLAALVSEKLGECDTEVVVRDRLPAIDELLKLMARSLPGSDAPGVLDVRGVTVEAMRGFAEAAREFYESAPWRHLTNRDLIDIRAMAPPEMRYAVVLGNGRSERGLGFFESERVFWEVLSGQRPPGEGGVPSWRLLFVSVSELPPDDAALWEREALPVAGANAFPFASCVRSSKRVKRPSPRVLEFLTGLLRALASTGPEELDSGRWEKRTEVSEGRPRQYEFVLPFSLDPPTHEERMRRGVLPDPRQLERWRYVLGKKLERLPSSEVEDVEDLVEREIFGQAVDRIPFEPRTEAEQAQEICFRAYDAWGRGQMKLAEEALAIDPECVDALVLRAELSGDAERALDLYDRAVSAGRPALEGARTEDPLGFESHWHTERLSRALHGLAHLHQELDHPDESLACFEELLALDDEDAEGARYCATSLVLEAGRFRAAERLIKAYSEKNDAFWWYARALAAFGQSGDRPKARKALRRSFELNPLVAAGLLGIDVSEIEDEVEGEGEGEREAETEFCIQKLRPAWFETDGALEWLGDRFEAEEPPE